VVLAAALALSAGARAGETSRSAPIPGPASELLARDYRLVPTYADLPESVHRALGAHLSNAPVADPGKPWDGTDARSNPPRPRYRLRFMGLADGAAFVAYEQGGRHVSDHLVLMSMKDGVLAVAYACDLKPSRGALDLPRLRTLARGCVPVNDGGKTR
jgi:hypothetical protein